MSEIQQKKIYKYNQHHSFDTELAIKYGVNEAILIHHFQYWITFNASNGYNFHDGKTWIYQTHKEISSLFPYWNEDAVRRIIERLVEKNVLIKGNYNKSNIDRTTWYAFKNEEMFSIPQKCGTDSAKVRNAFRESAAPIPNTIPNKDTPNINTPFIQQQQHPNLRARGGFPSDVVVVSEKKENELVSSEENQAFCQKTMFRLAITKKKDWTTQEMEDAWKIYCKSSKHVSEPFQYIEGIINKTRINNQEKEKKCQQTKSTPMNNTTDSCNKSIDINKLRSVADTPESPLRQFCYSLRHNLKLQHS